MSSSRRTRGILQPGLRIAKHAEQRDLTLPKPDIRDDETGHISRSLVTFDSDLANLDEVRPGLRSSNGYGSQKRKECRAR